jgi:hypothetical protein
MKIIEIEILMTSLRAFLCTQNGAVSPILLYGFLGIPRSEYPNLEHSPANESQPPWILFDTKIIEIHIQMAKV